MWYFLQPCSGVHRDTRAQQCAAFDHRPFRGRFYTWVPYVDGASPCTLNCRPLGQQFYASLALVVDGTPCTKPGFRAICIEGVCKCEYWIDTRTAIPAPWLQCLGKNKYVTSPWLFNLFKDSCLYDLKEYECPLRVNELSVQCFPLTRPSRNRRTIGVRVAGDGNYKALLNAIYAEDETSEQSIKED
ncbi:Papilin [Eumeta japonica]|uniref:Papilin n=1 Tax=Eumeta variegata TaxID=151549 RepID=A0A4C1T6K2_EUMVA|nr:Papilin [Eumeta japonica]